MTGLPIVLTTPTDGRYSVETTVSIWLHVAYGFPYGVPNDSRDYKRARRQAADDLRHLVRSEDVSTAPRHDGRLPIGVVIRRPSSWLPNDRPPKPMQIDPRRWIEQADLIRFAAERGVELFPETTARVSESEPIKAKPGAPIKIPDETIDIEPLSPGHPDINSKAIKFAVELELEQKRLGKKPNRTAACMEAVREHFPTHHDPEGKAKSLAASMRNRKRK